MIDDVSCSNPDCQVANNGSCLQGHTPIDSCPYYGEQGATHEFGESTSDEEDTTEGVLQKVPLHTGQPFSQGDFDDFLLEEFAKLIAVVGDTSSGKTTLLCSIYDKFQRGAFAGRTFAGSSTLTAFEQIAHRSRAISGASKPDTERTFLSQGLQYFHLATAPIDRPGEISHLFVSDRAGEIYRSGMDRPTELLGLNELKLCRAIVVLLDGARLVNPEEKYEVLESVRTLVRALVDSEAVSEMQHIQIVLTKCDEVGRSGRARELIEEVESVLNRLKQDFGNRFASISFKEISARDPRGDFQPAHGCDVLLESWCEFDAPSPKLVLPSLAMESEFDRLAINIVHGVKE